MALDSITLYHLTRELNPALAGARVDKVQQPEKDEVHLVLRNAGQIRRLLLNAGSTSARIHFTDQSKKNPASPPMFCMILRKHVEGGRITGLRQIGLERILVLSIRNYNDRGDLQDYDLFLEIMGKHSNLILVDSLSGTILDGIRRYSHLLSRHREVLPGRKYILPPSQNKTEPLALEEQWMAQLLKSDLDRKAADALLHVFNGISPELAGEIVVRARLAPDTFLDSCGEIDLSRLYQAYCFFLIAREKTRLDPCLYYQPAKKRLPVAFTILPYIQYGNLSRHPVSTLNAAVELYYNQKADYNQNEAMRGSLRKAVQEQTAHLNKKLCIYEETITRARKSFGLRKFGELLTANIYKLSPGMQEITLDDYTDPDLKPCTIPLDPTLSGVENAQHYFKFYNKAKAAMQKTLPFQLAALEELAYLQSLALSIDQAGSNEELSDIRQELLDQGYLRSKSVPNTSLKSKEAARRSGHSHSKLQNHSGSKNSSSSHSASCPHGSSGSHSSSGPLLSSRPHLYISKTGRTIIVGRNNKQNDRMTWREAKPSDLWLHVKNIPGSHVIVPLPENKEFPDDETLLDAAALAVYFSQARGSSQVPVDYTHVKHIKKPRGAKPGMVVYEQNWSLLLTPEPQDIERLLATEEEN